MLHAKAVTAEGRRPDGPTEYPAACTRAQGGEYAIALTGEPPASTASEWTVLASNLWQWAVGSNLQPTKLRGEQVPLSVGERCVVALHPDTSSLQAVQACSCSFRGPSLGCD